MPGPEEPVRRTGRDRDTVSTLKSRSTEPSKADFGRGYSRADDFDEYESLLGKGGADRINGPRLGGWMDGCWGLLFLLHLPVTGYVIWTEVQQVQPQLHLGQLSAIAGLTGLAGGMAVLATTIWIGIQFSMTSCALGIEIGFQLVVLSGLIVFLCVSHLDKWYWLAPPALGIAHLLFFLWSNWHPLKLTAEIARGVHIALKACWGLPIAMFFILLPGIFVVGSALFFFAVYWAVCSTPSLGFLMAPRPTVVAYVLFSLYWSVGTLINVAFLTAAQTVCGWMYNPTQNSVVWALLASWTKGIGSASFAALAAGPCRFVFGLHLIRHPYAESRPKAEQGSLQTLACLCGECISLENPPIVQVLNAAALTHVALHGRGFCASARSLARERSQPGIGTIHSWNLLGQLAGFTSSLALALSAGLLMWACVEWIPWSHDLTKRSRETNSVMPAGVFYILLAGLGGGLLAPLACFVSAGAQAIVAVYATDAELVKRNLPQVHNAFRIHVLAAEADQESAREPLDEPGPEPA